MWRGSLRKRLTRRTLLIMRLSIVLLFGVFCQLSASSLAQKVVIHKNHITYKALFKEVEKQTGLITIYNNSQVDMQEKIELSAIELEINDLYIEILKDKGLTFEVMDEYIVIKKAVKNVVNNVVKKAVVTEQQDQKIIIRGTVRDEKGEPLPFVAIKIKGTIMGSVSGLDGTYELVFLDEEELILEISSLGFVTQEIPINGRTIIDIVMVEDVMGLEEVVVVGYGQTKLEDFTGSVSSINKRIIEKATYPSVTAALEGSAAGVQVLTSNEPGGGTTLSVRGVASLGSSSPLYVVDGVIVGNSIIETLPASSIKSIDILKDAASTAIYGSRGANGIVMITTKEGHIGDRPKVVFNFYTKIDRPYYERKPLSGDEYRKLILEAADREVEVGKPDSDALLIHELREDAFNGANTDWLDEISQFAYVVNSEMSVTGGSKTMQYSMSVSAFSQDGVIKNDHLEKLSGRLRLSVDLTNWMTLKTNNFLSTSKHDDVIVSLHKGLSASPDDPVYDEDGMFFTRNNKDNPIQLFDATRLKKTMSLTNSFGLEIKPIKSLTFQTMLNASNRFYRGSNFDPSTTVSGGAMGGFNGRGSESANYSTKIMWDNTLSYRLEKNRSKLDVVGGVSLEESKGNYFSARAEEYPFDDFLTGIGNAAVPLYIDGANSETIGMCSFFARANYIFNNKYLFTFTNRYDGHSSFGENNKFGYFPSGAVAWKLAEEEFFNIDLIKRLTLKSSYGVSGSQNLPGQAHINTFHTTSWQGMPGLAMGSGLGNPDLRWETSKQLDVGMEFDLRIGLNGSVNYYHKTTDDLLYRRFLPASAGKSYIYQNIGLVENKGFEITLGYNYQHNDFGFYCNLNISANRNKLKYLTEEGNLDSFLDVPVYGFNYSNTNIIGYAMGQILGFEVEGTYGSWEELAALDAGAAKATDNPYRRYYHYEDRPGYFKYKDQNGDGYIDNNDKVILGDPEPDFFGGLHTGASYKGFELMMNFDFIVGGDRIYSSGQSNLPAYGVNVIDYNLNRDWKLGDKNAMLPALYLTDPVLPLNNRQVYKTTYLRLKDIRLDYTFNKKIAFIDQLTLYASASNVFVLTKYPGAKKTGSSYGLTQEVAYYPEIKSYVFGLQLKF